LTVACNSINDNSVNRNLTLLLSNALLLRGAAVGI
jgi:hypothetical protein